MSTTRRACKPFVIAKVLTAEKHPDADRLRVLMVDTGDGAPVQVVCGAPNARAGLVGAFAAPGTYVPGIDVTLDGRQDPRRRKPRHDVLRSASWRCRTSMTASSTCPPMRRSARAYAAYAHLDDPVIEINLTPNRPDCTSIYGIARDLAASGLGTLKTRAGRADRRQRRDAGEGDDRFGAGALPRLRAAPRARRQERPVPEMDAAAADRHRPAPHQRAGRHHQLHHLRPGPAAARLRRRRRSRAT